MKVKTKIGMGMKLKKKTLMKKRILSMKRGDVFLPALDALESLISGAPSLARTVNDSARRQFDVRAATSQSCDGIGLYFDPYKREQGVTAKKKKSQRDDKNAV